MHSICGLARFITVAVAVHSKGLGSQLSRLAPEHGFRLAQQPVRGPTELEVVGAVAAQGGPEAVASRALLPLRRPTLVAVLTAHLEDSPAEHAVTLVHGLLCN
jgi:hypothetical protein